VSAGVVTPLIIEPGNGAAGIGETPTLKSSAFAVVGGVDAHASTDWELWEGMPETGVKVLDVLASTQSKLSLQLPSGLLRTNLEYHPRVRHRGAALAASAWSPLSTFNTGSSFVPTTPGSPYGGGYYAGRYLLDGKTYALIVSPKAFGESPDRGPFAFDDQVFFSITSSDIDGFKNCQTLGTISPFATWARSLTIGGYNDWYLPASYELEILFRAFKLGPGDNWAHNIPNPYSLPPGPLYTLTEPGMTADPRFRFGGSEAMDSDSSMYRSSSWLSITNIFLMMNNGMTTSTHISSSGLSARAVRRVLIPA
jgi:hypothetical protein